MWLTQIGIARDPHINVVKLTYPSTVKFLTINIQYDDLKFMKVVYYS